MKYGHGGDIYSYPQIVDFSANINPFGTPAELVTAIKNAAEAVAPYPDYSYRELRQALAEREGISVDKVICGNGAADLIYRFVMAIHPKKALLAVPCFSEYEHALQCVGCQVVHYQLNRETFVLEEDYLDWLDASLDMICLCTPNNPTGMSLSSELFEKIIKKCKENKITFLLDECFYDFVEEEKQLPLYRKREQVEGMLTLRAFTKMYGLAGVRLGYGFSADIKLLEKMQVCGPPWNVSTLAQKAGLAALQMEEYPKKVRAYIQEQKAYLLAQLEQMKVKVWHSDANYILFCAKKQLKEDMIKQGFLIRDCGNYAGLQSGYYRIAVKTEAENKAFIKAFKKAIE